jgi:hypothetical protein
MHASLGGKVNLLHARAGKGNGGFEETLALPDEG